MRSAGSFAKHMDSFHFAFKMIPRRRGGGDGGVPKQQYVEESATQPTPVALEFELESSVVFGRTILWREKK